MTCDINLHDLRSVQNPENKTIIGVPNGGRSYALLEDLISLTSFKSNAWNSRALLLELNGIIFLKARSEDLPHLLKNKIVDAVITGLDYMLDADAGFIELLDLGLLKAKMCVIERIGTPIFDVGEKHIVVSQYENIAKKYLKSTNSSGKVVAVHGAAEVYVNFGAANMAVDIVDTGVTATSNNLRIKEILFDSSIRMFMNSDGKLNPSLNFFVSELKDSLENS